MEKKIQITPNLFKLQKTKNTKKTRSKQNINKLLRKIKEHAAKKNPELKFNKETKLKDHINYLEELSKKNKKTRSNRTKEQVSIKLPNELNTVTNANIVPIKNESFKITTTINKEPPYGNLKGGPKPTYREWKRLTQKNNIKMTDSPPINNPPINNSPINNPPINNPPINNPPINNPPINTKKYLKKSKKTKYTLGKVKDTKKVGILISNNKTQKRIREDCNKLDKASLTEVKLYLKKHNLYKSGSTSPPEILREIYKSAHLAGKPVINISKENLLHNFYKI